MEIPCMVIHANSPPTRAHTHTHTHTHTHHTHMLTHQTHTPWLECTTFAPATILIAAMINANVKHNPNPNPNPNLNPYPTLKHKPNHYPHSTSLSLEISSQEQLSPEQLSDHPWETCWSWLTLLYTHIIFPMLLLMRNFIYYRYQIHPNPVTLTIIIIYPIVSKFVRTIIILRSPDMQMFS